MNAFFLPLPFEIPIALPVLLTSSFLTFCCLYQYSSSSELMNPPPFLFQKKKQKKKADRQQINNHTNIEIKKSEPITLSNKSVLFFLFNSEESNKPHRFKVSI
jgi:hypothetical protein